MQTRQRLDSVIAALVLVRLGQELGTSSPLAVAIHGAVEALLGILRGGGGG